MGILIFTVDLICEMSLSLLETSKKSAVEVCKMTSKFNLFKDDTILWSHSCSLTVLRMIQKLVRCIHSGGEYELV